MSVLRPGLTIMRRDRKALTVFGVGALGLFALGILLSMVFPQQSHSATSTGGTLPPGLKDFFDTTFAEKNVALTALAIFFVNLVAISLIQTTIPSLVIPFLGVVLTAVRLTSWGVIFTPIGESDPSFLVHWVTLLIEGAAYVLVAFAAWVQGRMFLQPARYGLAGRARGYVAGLRATAALYVWVIVVLVVGALYEASTLIFVLH